MSIWLYVTTHTQERKLKSFQKVWRWTKTYISLLRQTKNHQVSMVIVNQSFLYNQQQRNEQRVLCSHHLFAMCSLLTLHSHLFKKDERKKDPQTSTPTTFQGLVLNWMQHFINCSFLACSCRIKAWKRREEMEGLWTVSFWMKEEYSFIWRRAIFQKFFLAFPIEWYDGSEEYSIQVINRCASTLFRIEFLKGIKIVYSLYLTDWLIANS